MARRLHIPVMVFAAFLSMGASFRTQNFVVEAATPEIAQQVGQYAEHYRREKALQWVGREMPTWPQPCPLKVTVTMRGSGGATSFAFDRGRILGQRMQIEGTLDRLLASVLPHEVTHTVFAHHFRQPVPRWADEGGSVLSEDEVEKRRHDQLVRQVLNQRRAMPLRRLFSLREYPSDVMVLYAQGFSVADFLVSRSSRGAFLNFVADGMRAGWDQAAQAHYRFNSVEELEQAWLQHLRNPRQQPPASQIVASGPAKLGRPQGDQVVVRQTAPPVHPLLEAPRPIIRAQAPDEEPSQPFRPTSTKSPVGCPSGRCPLVPGGQPPRVQLLPPQFGPAPPAGIGVPVPASGFPQ